MPLKSRYEYGCTKVENHQLDRKYVGYNIVERLSMQTFHQEGNLTKCVVFELYCF